jgi:phosphoglucomutase
VLDLDAIRGAGLRMGVDPLGGAGVHYWGPIAERYRLDLTVVNETVDPTFRVHDPGLGRQDPHGLLLAVRDGRPDRDADRFDVAFACDTDHDRHGIVTRGAG